MREHIQKDPRLIGDIYRVGQAITTGGMLSTYTAYNRNTNDVAGLFILELPSQAQVNMAEQLLQQFEKRRTLQSPHVIHVYNWGIDGNRAYIATDPPRGLTLQHVLDNENIDIPRAINLIRQTAYGVKALHEQGIVGLDLRPQLITVDTVGVTDRVQVDDIGLRSLLLALGYVSSQQVSDIGYLDPRYAPPEYINAGHIGPWSDTYQLGLLLFTLVTGRLPFVGRTPAETGIMQSNSPLPPMTQFKHDTPPLLQQLVEHTLTKEPPGRFTNIAAFLTALDTVSPPQRTGTMERITAVQPTTGPRNPVTGTNFTSEMPLVQDDVTLRATNLEKKGAPPQASTEMPILNVPAAGVYAYLVHEKQDKTLQRFAMTQRSIIVGRLDPKRGVSPDLDLSSIDPTMTISRQHARIRFEETFFYIEDLKSRNKTRLGELVLTPLKAELLQHGDTIQFGSVRVIFEVPGMAKPPVFKEYKKA